MSIEAKEGRLINQSIKREGAESKIKNKPFVINESGHAKIKRNIEPRRGKTKRNILTKIDSAKNNKTQMLLECTTSCLGESCTGEPHSHAHGNDTQVAVTILWARRKEHRQM